MTKWQYTDASQAIVSKSTPEGGVWTCSVDDPEFRQWVLDGNTPDPAPPTTPEQALAAAKAARLVAVDRIQVTTQAGHTFDGDEISQGRMARAILALDAAGQASTTWVLSNNTPTTVTRDDLQQALVLAGQEQTRLWLLPWEKA